MKGGENMLIPIVTTVDTKVNGENVLGCKAKPETVDICFSNLFKSKLGLQMATKAVFDGTILNSDKISVLSEALSSLVKEYKYSKNHYAASEIDAENLISLTDITGFPQISELNYSLGLLPFQSLETSIFGGSSTENTVATGKSLSSLSSNNFDLVEYATSDLIDTSSGSGIAADNSVGSLTLLSFGKDHNAIVPESDIAKGTGIMGKSSEANAYVELPNLDKLSILPSDSSIEIKHLTNAMKLDTGLSVDSIEMEANAKTIFATKNMDLTHADLSYAASSNVIKSNQIHDKAIYDSLFIKQNYQSITDFSAIDKKVVNQLILQTVDSKGAVQEFYTETGTSENSFLDSFNQGNDKLSETVISQNRNDFDFSLKQMQLGETIPEIPMNVSRIVEKFNFLISEGHSELILQVSPENLGKIALKIVDDNGVLSAVIATETVQARELLLSQVNELKTSLREQGLDFFRLDVNLSNGNRQQQHFNRYQNVIQEGRYVGNTKLETRSHYAEPSQISRLYGNSVSQIDFFA